ncbi:MAG: GntR family transcriptional regulator [Paludibacter sp.]|nr:GntR family transcriptional regulator [Paludibacter sp.]
MEFNQNQAIYLQIGDYICEQILLGKWNEGDRILSVRELGVELQVNPNTVLRTFDFLQTHEIIFNKRGVGYFVMENAKIKIIAYRRKQFLELELPILFKNMDLLGMTISDLNSEYEQYTKSLA